MSQWEHTGFSVHKDIDMDAGDDEGLTRMTISISLCLVAEAKIHQKDPADDVLYDGHHPNPLLFQMWWALPTERMITRNFEVFDPLDFLAHRSCIRLI